MFLSENTNESKALLTLAPVLTKWKGTSNMANPTLPLPLEFHNGEEPLTVEVQLTKGYAAIIDAVDADLLICKYCAHVDKTTPTKVYAEHQIRIAGRQRTTLLHREIMARILNRQLDSREWVDHIDNNTLNNRRSNLRLVTFRQSAQNKTVNSRNSSGLKGVQRTGKGGRWFSTIKVDGKSHHLGFFDTPEEAHEAYKVAAIKYFGEYARWE